MNYLNKLFSLFILVSLFINNVYCACQGGYTASGNACIQNRYFSLSMCDQTTGNGMRLVDGTNPPCAVIAANSAMVLPGTTLTLYTCTITWKGIYWVIYTIPGGCASGGALASTQSITFNYGSNRYFVMTFARNVMDFYAYETTSSPNPSQAQLNYLASQGWTYVSHTVWDSYANVICPTGFQSNGAGGCVDINECTSGTSGCAQGCSNTNGGFTCSCNAGYRLNGNGKSCDDINECSEGSSGCSHSCVNSPAGSFTCSCPAGYRLGSNKKTCAEIDECAENTDGCSHTCTNSPAGSFTCSCPAGYRLGADKKTCAEIDECAENTDGCSHTCTNSPAGSFTCSCPAGYRLGSDKKTCTEIDECAENTDGCAQTCTNLPVGSFTCSCLVGYTLGSDSKSCNDINECVSTPNPCGESNCNNVGGSYYCSCDLGYALSSNNQTCNDIDECTDVPNSCQGNAICHNSVGSYSCSCPSNFELALNKTACNDIDECLSNTHECTGVASCVNNYGSEYTCVCPTDGYNLSEDGKSCIDIDECLLGTHECTGVATCVNNIGIDYTCICPPTGYTLSADGKSCNDIDECSLGTDLCTGDFTTCENTQGDYLCNCPTGFISISNGKDCQDIDECTSNIHECIDNTVCLNLNGTYSCPCIPHYSRVTQYQCEAKPIITSFYQKPIEYYTFIVEGFNFNQNSVVTITYNESTFVNCQYKSGNETVVECTTRKGLEVIGNVSVETNNIKSDDFKFIGAPFINSTSKHPLTTGEEITFSGRNFPTGESTKLTINGIQCPITLNENNGELIKCKVPEGSGDLNYVVLVNDTVSNTDNIYITYANPYIESTSVVYITGGVLTITGSNFGTFKSIATVSIGNHQCKNVVIESHNTITCELEATNKIYTQIINLQVDGLQVENDYYFTCSSLDTDICQDNCNNDIGKGECTPFGCVCIDGFTGISCNETSTVIVPSFPPPNPEIPLIEVGNGDGDDNKFGYKITILRIEEVDINNQVINGTSIPLLDKSWNSTIGTNVNSWIFNITLSENQSYLETTFEYFKQSKSVTFASSTFIIPSESLKLSFKTKQWPFQSKLNTLRIVIQSETLVKNDTDQCSIGNTITTTYNQHLWTTTENQESGMIARFVSVAELDYSISITANIEDLSSELNNTNSNKISLIGISLPYFKHQAIIDPDFGLLLNVNGEKVTGNCISKSSINWKLATGLSIGGAGLLCIAASATYFQRKKKKDNQLKNIITNRSNGINRMNQ